MKAAVIVPWRGGDPDREKAWAWLRPWWEQHLPVVVGTAQDDGPWCKAAAVADALARTDADLLVVADADVYVPDGLNLAVDMVAAGRVAWAMPHLRVYRLTSAGTDRLMKTGKLPPPARVDPPRGGGPVGERMVAESHKGKEGGGCVVLTRRLYELAPMDPRFLGWGQEDEAWGRALTVLAGPAQRVAAPLWHLWHNPPARVGPDAPPGHSRFKRSIGNLAGLELYRRYRAASTPAQMLALLAEFTAGGSSTETARSGQGVG